MSNLLALPSTKFMLKHLAIQLPKNKTKESSVMLQWWRTRHTALAEDLSLFPRIPTPHPPESGRAEWELTLKIVLCSQVVVAHAL